MPPPATKFDHIVLIREAERDGRPLDIGYLPDFFTRCHFPMKRPPSDMKQWRRRDGREVLLITTDADSTEGLPFGADLVTLFGFMTRAREMRSPIITFDSTAQMLEYMELPRTGQSYRWMLGSCKRLFGATIKRIEEFERDLAGAQRRREEKGTFVDAIDLWYQVDDRRLREALPNTIRLSPEVMQWLRGAPSLESDKLITLRQHVGALQLFVLLRARCSHPGLAERGYSWIPLHGPNSLESQLGWVRPPLRRKVRFLVKAWLTLIRDLVWPECPGDIYQGGDGNWRLKITYVPRPVADRRSAIK